MLEYPAMTKRMRTASILAAALTATLVPSIQASTLIVANKSEATVSLVSLPSGKIAATLPVGTGPHEVAISRDGKRALVSNYGVAGKPGSSLTLIDVEGAKVLKTIELGEAHGKPHGMVWIGEGKALVTSEAGENLLEVDVEAGKVVRAMPTGQRVSHMVVVTPDTSLAFVANIGAGNITAFNLKEGKKLGDIQTGAGAEGIAVTPDGKQVWVTNRAADTVSVVDTATLLVTKTFEAPAFPIRAEVTPDGKRVLISLAKSGDVAVFATAGPALERRIALPAPPVADRGGRLLADFGDSSIPIGIEIAPDGKRAYVAHANADQISIIDLESFKKVGSLTAGKEPDGMGMSPLDVKPAK